DLDGAAAFSALSRGMGYQPMVFKQRHGLVAHVTPHAMPANRFNGYTDLGIGIGLRVPHYTHILSQKPTCDWFEIISENFMCDGGRPLEVLDEILEQYRVVQHGVSLYFGSTDPIDRAQLRRFQELGRGT